MWGASDVAGVQEGGRHSPRSLSSRHLVGYLVVIDYSSLQYSMSSSVPQYTRPTTSTNSPYLQALDDEPSAPPPASPPQYEPVASTSTSYSATADSSSTSATTHTTAKPERIPTPQRTLSSLSNKKCWVCFEEEAESTEQREWVHACKCTLVAHSDVSLSARSLGSRALTKAVSTVPTRMVRNFRLHSSNATQMSRLRHSLHCARIHLCPPHAIQSRSSALGQSGHHCRFRWSVG